MPLLNLPYLCQTLPPPLTGSHPLSSSTFSRANILHGSTLCSALSLSHRAFSVINLLSYSIKEQVMAAILSSHDQVEDEEEYVLLDLDGVSGQVHIPPNAPYVLSGLDTLNPILVIDNKVKLIGEYEETIGTCFVFTEGECPVVHEETGPSEANLFSGKFIIDPKQPLAKEVKPVARLHKVLKFRLLVETDIEDITVDPAS
ncbi:hypothetical protein Vadar_001499 [Vaccinium darrowii]|uniref:Uncharacterized protein n=1 Tax=Vaccinium darrowii TaxID=229202 RepID=A0ACB7XMC8_9ERIC|nr:hypothetical protein Vadar_001499 [Vaccinium darrowii]